MTTPVKREIQTLWIWEDNRIIKRLVTFIPCLYRLFDEILLSAVHSKDCNIRVRLKEDIVSVWSNGDVLPNLGSSNFFEALQLLTQFTVQRANGEVVTEEVFTNIENKKIIRECNTTEKWTRVSFKPDIECLKDDTFTLMKRRVVDLAGSLARSASGKVDLHGTVLPNTFQEYVQLYPETSGTHSTRIYEKVNDRWEICVGISDGQFDQVSFVNNIATMKGGSHVDYIRSQITHYLANTLKLEPNVIERYLWVFVNAHIDDPTFDSPTKEKLTTIEGSFGSTCELKPELLEKILDSHLINNDVKKLNIEKLVDAPLANSRYSQHSTLILVEGDTAKDFALSGLPIMGRFKYGVFPLKGKLLNVKDASANKVKKNIQIQDIKKILGLQDGKIYKNVNELRYGHLMIMADQDYDGIHIKGLLINLLHQFWPSLLEVETFLQTFITPVVKAYDPTNDEVLLFYSLSKYEAWTGNVGNKYNVRYYKGLGAIEVAEGERCFTYCDEHIKYFVYTGEKDDNAIQLAFSNKKVEERKRWLDAPRAPEDDFDDFDPKQKCIQIVDFISKDFKQFARSFLKRSIASIVDGFKPVHRKIMHGAFKMLDTKNMKIESFGGDLIELTAYHHGLMSLVKTIEGMCRLYVGSNNINLLLPLGQFGTQKKALKHARYYDTYLSPITRYIFHKVDECVLKHLYAFGRRIEPLWFIPIIPMVLVNGSEGIGFGWSSTILNYNPREVIENLKHLVKGEEEEMTSMLPWYKGFNGDITQSNTSSYTVTGKIIEDDTHPLTIRISELALITKQDYEKSFLKPASQAKKVIVDYKACNDNSDALFEVTMTKDQMNKARKMGQLLKKLKLTTILKTSNMHMFNANGQIKKYHTLKTILQEFHRVRRDFYKKRKRALLRKLRKGALKLRNKLNYINQVGDGELNMFKKSMDAKIALLKANHFQSLPEIANQVRLVEEQDEEEAGAGNASETETGYDYEEQDEEEAGNASETETGYDYLMNVNVGKLTDEDIQKLEEKMNAKNEEADHLLNTSIQSLWETDLEALDKQLDLEGFPKVEKAAKRARDAARQSSNKKRRMQ